MGKNNVVSGVLALVVILMIAITTFAVVNYGTGILGATVAFVASSQGKLEACGIAAPPELLKLQADIPGLLVPAIYVGFPSLMVIISILMFIAGHYYGNDKQGSVSSETTTTTSSPNRKRGKYAPGRRVEQTRMQKSTKTEGT
ncbi:MAG: hypothetical protein WC263_00605 [Candidatus Micrarchaeia archaeon]|jgi:hypothetical protein